jgi:hypothetical protein
MRLSPFPRITCLPAELWAAAWVQPTAPSPSSLEPKADPGGDLGIRDTIVLEYDPTDGVPIRSGRTFLFRARRGLVSLDATRWRGCDVQPDWRRATQADDVVQRRPGRRLSALSDRRIHVHTPLQAGDVSGTPFFAKIIASSRAGCVSLALRETSCVLPGGSKNISPVL